ncbi:hypothetical protein F5Y16DRAFT_128986 [Xylariaceae sp. FL0255]|nr:hypothetical protein F5Y16DRAFT_128986 [Xylariaceae sp. FL0255]
MDYQQEFQVFPKLPAELRHEIWRVALCSNCLTEVLHVDGGARLSPLEWDPSVLGQVCHEARWFMVKLTQRVPWPLSSRGQAYLNFEASILHFGPAASARERVASLGEPAYSNLAYAALIWTSWNDVARSFRLFSERFLCLKTVFIFAADQVYNANPRPLRVTDLALINAAFAQDTDTFEPNKLDLEWICKELRGWFTPPLTPPRVITLPL